jgi:hypothetical protein
MIIIVFPWNIFHPGLNNQSSFDGLASRKEILT